jgi:predicted  nucleic acid-binding Zn-ribbon protein
LLDIENSLAKIKDKKKEIDSEYKKILAEHEHLQHVVKLCDTLLYTYGFNIHAINSLLEISKKYGGLYPLMEAIGKYENITHLNNEIQNIADRKIALESSVKELQEQAISMRSEVDELQKSITATTNSISKQFINSTDKISKTYETSTETLASSLKNFQQDMTKTYTDSLKEITEQIPETASVIGAIDTKIERAKSLSLMIDLIEKPYEIKEPIEQVYASVISLVKGMELYTELNKDNIDKSMYIKSNLSNLHSNLLETIQIEHKKTTTETQTKT